MKNMLLLIISTVIITNTSYSQETTSVGQQINSLRKIKEQIETLDAAMQTLQTYVNATIACGDNTPPQHFNGTNCVTINERDPHIEMHGKQNLSGTSCPDSNQAQQFNGSSWSCKTFN